jgi:pyruvate formate lyase activating enzyme
MKRRSFLRCVGCGALAASVSHTDLWPEFLGGVQNAYAFDLTDKLSSVEARYYKRLEAGGIECNICPRHCRVTDLERGYCGTRENRGDTYYPLVHNLPCALNIDPIEKKRRYPSLDPSRQITTAFRRRTQLICVLPARYRLSRTPTRSLSFSTSTCTTWQS